MTWAKLDDGWHSSPKVRAAGPFGALLHARSICYACQHLTDGFIPADALPGLTSDFTTTPDGGWAAHMIGRGLWRPAMPGGLVNSSSGWWVHDFLRYNPSRAQHEARSSKGQRAAAARWDAKGTAPRIPRDPMPRPMPLASVMPRAMPNPMPNAGSTTESKETTSPAPSNGFGMTHRAAPPWRHAVPDPPRRALAIEREKRRQTLTDELGQAHPAWTSRRLEDAVLAKLATEFPDPTSPETSDAF